MGTYQSSIDPPEGHCLSTCWCGRAYVHVPVKLVRAGRTVACSYAFCYRRYKDRHAA